MSIDFEAYKYLDSIEEPTEEEIKLYYKFYSMENESLYEHLRNGFFPDPDPVNGHWGKHSIRIAREICEITKPSSIMEIGFNMGHSAGMFKHYSGMSTKMLSVDISMHPNTLFAAGVFSLRCGDRFQFLNSSSFNLYATRDTSEEFGKLSLKLEPDLRQCDDAFKYPRSEPYLYNPYSDKMFDTFDLVFIDGDHLYESVKNDTQLALNLNPKWIVFDDLWRCWGPSVMDVINEFGLKIYKRWGNVGLVKL